MFDKYVCHNMMFHEWGMTIMHLIPAKLIEQFSFLACFFFSWKRVIFIQGNLSSIFSTRCCNRIFLTQSYPYDCYFYQTLDVSSHNNIRSLLALDFFQQPSGVTLVVSDTKVLNIFLETRMHIIWFWTVVKLANSREINWDQLFC